MIPTYATTGEAIAFGGRALGDDEPKYLNTATTPVYTKGHYLYALGAARRAAGKEDAVIVVEGYLDCIALHQAGFANAVAALGTAFTPDQARELVKVTPNIFVCFDADAAGRAATAKSVDVLVAAGGSARIVTLPAGDDPDSYVRAHGADGFRRLLSDAIPWVQFKIDHEVEALRTGFTGAAEIARRAEALVQHLPREEWDRWRVYIAGRLGLNVDDLRKSRLLRATSAVRSGRHVVPGTVEPPSFERDVLAIVMDEPQLLGEYAASIAPERFENALLRRIFAALVERRAEILQPSDVLALFSEDDDATATLTAIAGSERSATVRFVDGDARRAFMDRVVQRFAADDLQRRYREVDSTVNQLFESGRPIPRELRDEHNQLAATLRGAKLKG
jgi:DNA primase